jgi:hypothetical protein
MAYIDMTAPDAEQPITVNEVLDDDLVDLRSQLAMQGDYSKVTEQLHEYFLGGLSEPCTLPWMRLG